MSLTSSREDLQSSISESNLHNKEQKSTSFQSCATQTVKLKNEKDDFLYFQIQEMELEIRKLHIENEQLLEKINFVNEKHDQEISLFKSKDPIERFNRLILSLQDKRRHLPLLLNKKNINTKQELLQDQEQVELELLNSLMTFLKNFLQTHHTNESTLKIDILPILQQLQDCRNKLSYTMSDDDFIVFLEKHIEQLQDILIIIHSSCKNLNQDELFLNLSAYESGIIKYTKKGPNNYLTISENIFNLQKRLLASYYYIPLSPFKSPTIRYHHLFCKLEDAIHKTVVISNPNHIVFIPPAKNSDCCIALQAHSFYTLTAIKKSDNNSLDQEADMKQRIWKLDPFALNAISLFSHMFLQKATDEFRFFYREAFGHNNYIKDFPLILEKRGVERWSQMKLLLENIEICSDEYLLGEIYRKTLRQNVPFYPSEKTDNYTIRSCKDICDQYCEIYDHVKKHGSPSSDPPEEYMYDLFDSCKDWDISIARNNYQSRWKEWMRNNLSDYE